MQDPASRTKAFEQMDQEDIELQKRLLNKQLSTVVELLGVQFIVNRPSRGRIFEQKFGKYSSKYTQKYKDIDDLNETCEIIKLSQSETVKRMPYQTVERKTKEILKKVQGPFYKPYTIYRIYQETPEESQPSLEELALEQDWKPVMQTLVVNSTGKNNSLVKKIIGYVNKEDEMTKEETRFYDINPTYIVTFSK
jgi:hypothetical protein